MADTTSAVETDVTDVVEGEEQELTEYTSESETPVVEARKPAASGPGAATGRRKQAIARVRIVPGSGQWKINNRTLDVLTAPDINKKIITGAIIIHTKPIILLS